MDQEKKKEFNTEVAHILNQLEADLRLAVSKDERDSIKDAIKFFKKESLRETREARG